MTTPHVFETMGTVVSLHSPEHLGAEVRSSVESVFAAVDRRFSLYDDDSELSRIVDGRLSLLDASAELLDAYDHSLQWRARTLGVFSPHRPDGALDLSGIVKALAIAEAGAVLDDAGIRCWSIDCGGDDLQRRPADAPEAVAGIADPDRPGRLLTRLVIPSPRRAIATSGVSERGEHVWGPRVDFAQVTVIADDIVTADVLATAILAGGTELCDLAADTVDCDILAVRRDGGIIATPGVRLAAADPALGSTVSGS